jgi:uncharacterized protein YqjF (DUF2071 family)
MSSPFLTAEWRKLVLINYVIDAHHLVPYIPYGTVLDTYNDTCYVSVVGFMFLDSKIKGFPIPFHQDFEEVNFRFYVKRQTKNGAWRRGVVFIKEFVPKVMVSVIANHVYKENYETLEMDHTWQERTDTLEVEYTLTSPDHSGSDKAYFMRVTADRNAIEIPAACEAEFITEHYWGYTKIDPYKTTEYEVWHPRWKTYPVKAFSCNFDFNALYGKEFAFMNDLKPFSVMLAEGSEVKLMDGLVLQE